MTLLSYHLATCSLLHTIAISLALNTPQNPGSILVSTKPSSPLASVNTSAASENSTAKDVLLLNPTTLTAVEIECDDEKFGNPPAASCRDAMAQIPQDAATILENPLRSYGPRGQGTWDVNLPKRYISSDGQCIIDFSQTSFPSHVRSNDLLMAGTSIQHECVDEDTPPWGGEAFDMGDELNFLLTMKSYRPPIIRCTDTPPAARPESTSCQAILDTMNASSAQTIFGAVGVPEVEEYLPQVLTEPTGTCSITVDTTVPEVEASWYDLWQAAVALDGLCARAGRTGKARFLGINRKLVMEIKRS